jgi:hypothetical protein
MAKSKTTDNNGSKCPLSRERFLKAAKPLTITVDGKTLTLSPKMFSTGSFGWFDNPKVTIEVDGVLCKVQTSINLIVVGSKEMKS